MNSGPSSPDPVETQGCNLTRIKMTVEIENGALKDVPDEGAVAPAPSFTARRSNRLRKPTLKGSNASEESSEKPKSKRRSYPSNSKSPAKRVRRSEYLARVVHDVVEIEERLDKTKENLPFAESNSNVEPSSHVSLQPAHHQLERLLREKELEVTVLRTALLEKGDASTLEWGAEKVGTPTPPKVPEEEEKVLYIHEMERKLETFKEESERTVSDVIKDRMDLSKLNFHLKQEKEKAEEDGRRWKKELELEKKRVAYLLQFLKQKGHDLSNTDLNDLDLDKIKKTRRKVKKEDSLLGWFKKEEAFSKPNSPLDTALPVPSPMTPAAAYTIIDEPGDAGECGPLSFASDFICDIPLEQFSIDDTSMSNRQTVCDNKGKTVFTAGDDIIPKKVTEVLRKCEDDPSVTQDLRNDLLLSSSSSSEDDEEDAVEGGIKAMPLTLELNLDFITPITTGESGESNSSPDSAYCSPESQGSLSLPDKEQPSLSTLETITHSMVQGELATSSSDVTSSESEDEEGQISCPSDAEKKDPVIENKVELGTAPRVSIQNRLRSEVNKIVAVNATSNLCEKKKLELFLKNNFDKKRNLLATVTPHLATTSAIMLPKDVSPAIVKRVIPIVPKPLLTSTTTSVSNSNVAKDLSLSDSEDERDGSPAKAMTLSSDSEPSSQPSPKKIKITPPQRKKRIAVFSSSSSSSEDEEESPKTSRNKSSMSSSGSNESVDDGERLPQSTNEKVTKEIKSSASVKKAVLTLKKKSLFSSSESEGEETPKTSYVSVEEPPKKVQVSLPMRKPMAPLSIATRRMATKVLTSSSAVVLDEEAGSVCLKGKKRVAHCKRNAEESCSEKNIAIIEKPAPEKLKVPVTRNRKPSIQNRQQEAGLKGHESNSKDNLSVELVGEGKGSPIKTPTPNPERNGGKDTPVVLKKGNRGGVTVVSSNPSPTIKEIQMTPNVKKSNEKSVSASPPKTLVTSPKKKKKKNKKKIKEKMPIPLSIIKEIETELEKSNPTSSERKFKRPTALSKKKLLGEGVQAQTKSLVIKPNTTLETVTHNPPKPITNLGEELINNSGGKTYHEMEVDAENHIQSLHDAKKCGSEKNTVPQLPLPPTAPVSTVGNHTAPSFGPEMMQNPTLFFGTVMQGIMLFMEQNGMMQMFQQHQQTMQLSNTTSSEELPQPQPQTTPIESEEKSDEEYDSPRSPPPCPSSPVVKTKGNKSLASVAVSVRHKQINKVKASIRSLYCCTEESIRDDWEQVGKDVVPKFLEIDREHLVIAIFEMAWCWNSVKTQKKNDEDKSSLWGSAVSKTIAQLVLIIEKLTEVPYFSDLPSLILRYFFENFLPGRTLSKRFIKEAKSACAIGQFLGLLTLHFSIPETVKKIFFNSLYWKPLDAQPIILSMLKVNGTYFNEFDSSCSTAYSIAERIGAHILLQMPRNFQTYCFQSLSSLLVKGMGWKVAKLTLGEMFQVAVKEILQMEGGVSLEEGTRAVSLLCRIWGNESFPYFRDQLMEATQMWIKNEVSDGVYAALIKVIGELGTLSLSQLSAEEVRPLREFLEQFSPHVKSSPFLKDAFASSLQQLENPPSIKPVLCHWAKVTKVEASGNSRRPFMRKRLVRNKGQGTKIAATANKGPCKQKKKKRKKNKKRKEKEDNTPL